MKNNKTYHLLEAREVFIITLIVVVLTMIAVYFWGLGQHHTFFENSLISTTILSVAFFLFITIGLYKGVKLKDNMGRVLDKFELIDTINFHVSGDSVDSLDMGEGIVGIIIGFIAWILLAILLSIALWIFTNVLVLIVLTFVAMLYWIFFRALRLVFKNSNKSKGNLIESVKWGVAYTLLYNFWIYGIFILTIKLKG